jgi:hypothetical protein
MMTKTTIAYVHHATLQSYRVVFSCGHRRTVRKSDFDREQWFIGQAVNCLFCTSREKSK